MQHEQSAKGKYCNMRRVQQLQESKTKTLQRVKVQPKKVQYIKRVQHEKKKKKCNIKRLLHKKVQHGNGEV